MIEKTVSKYATNSVASKKKHIFARLFDYFSTMVVSTIIFAVALPILSNASFFKSRVSDLNKVTEDFQLFVSSTHLETYNEETKKMSSINEEADKYLLYLAKTSAYVHSKDFPHKKDDGTYEYLPVNKEDTFINDLINYPLDNLSYYFNVYRPNVNELNDYNGKKYSECTQSEVDQYQFVTFMNMKATNYVSSDDPNYLIKGEGVSTFNVLTEDNTEQILHFYKGDKADTKLYNSIYSGYASGLQKCIREIEDKSLDYKKIKDRFDLAYQNLSIMEIVIFLVCYVIAYALLNLVISLVSKEWMTVGLRTMKLAIVDKDEMNPRVWKYLLYHLFSLLAFVTTSVITFMLINMFGITSAKIVGPISYLMIMLFILPFNLVSLFMPFFNKNSHDLSTFFTGIIIKDTREFDVPVGVDILDKEKDGREQKD